MPYLHVYRAPSGQWAGKVLEEIAGIAGCQNPVEVLEAALEQFPGIEDLPASVSIDGLREDGEPLTGVEEIDYPPDLAHPGNG
jgi:hypothetical protein